MPQDRLRSAVYRSFVTCDDPKGVIDCGRIRRYRNGLGKMKHKVEIEAQQASNSSKAQGREEMDHKRGSSEELESFSSLQLMEVSRGAEKLNQMIGSWSRRRSFDGQSEGVAKDLLKGALDLQESLVMLGKLQEASKYMTRLKKHNTVDELGIRRSRSDRFMGQNNLGGFEKPRLSVDRPSRDCIEQLREAIKDGFTKQKELLLHNTRIEDKSSEMPSTSSSQSSTDHSKSKRFGPQVSSLPPPALQKKAKAPNLIAKLMGLEEIPSKPVEAKQIPSQLKPRYDNDSVKEPIVLIRPIHAQWQDSMSRGPTLDEEGSCRLNFVLKKPEMKDEHQPKIASCNERFSKKKMPRKEVEQETLARKLSKKMCNDPRVEVKNEAIVKRVDKIHKVSGIRTRPVEKETVISQDQDQARVTKTKLGKPEKNGSNTRPHLILKSTRQPVNGRKEKRKPREKVESAQIIIENLACQEDKKNSTRRSKNDSPEKETCSTLTDQLSTEEESAALELHIEEDCTVNPKLAMDSENAQEDHSNDSKSLRTVLLSNPSFLCDVEDLFHLNVNFPLAAQASNINNLSLDFAKEFVKRRSLPDSRKIHPLLLACTGSTRMWISLDRLMGEVCDAIEALEGYSGLGGEDSAVDKLCAVSERDILSDGVVTGAWDLGWRSGFSVDEAEQVAVDLEKLLFTGLIEEAFG